jgi:predicted NBD/HSP70 family sugar kinase
MATNAVVEMPEPPERRILKALWSSAEDVTRADLAEMTGLSKSATEVAVRALKGKQLVDLTDGTTAATDQGGRPPKVVTLKDGRSVVVGIDIGFAHGRAVVATLTGRELARVDIQTPWRSIEELPGTEVLSRAAAAARAALAEAERSTEARISPEDVRAVTVGVPGPVDDERGVIASHAIMAPWRGLRPAEALAADLLWPAASFSIENDANLGALAEYHERVVAGPASMLYVKWASGVGLGVMSSGELVKGARGLAGEIGHVPVVFGSEARPCRCGLRGCLETVVGGRALVDAAMGSGDAALSDVSNLAQLIAIARDNDTARALVEQAARTLGRVIGPLVSALNPNFVVIGGEVAASADSLLRPGVFGGLQSTTLPPALDDVLLSIGDRRGASTCGGAVLHASRRAIAALI